MSITTREFSRTAAAFGAVLALVALSLPVDSTPVVASARTVAEAERPSADPTAETEASVSGDSAAAVSDDQNGSTKSTAVADDNGNAIGLGDEASANTDGAEADGAESDGGGAGPDAPAPGEPGKNCDPDKKQEPGKPCATKEPLKATYEKSTTNLRLERSKMPESWFDQPITVSEPDLVAYSPQSPQGTSGNDQHEAATTETDDSGHPIEAASAKKKYQFKDNEYIYDTGSDKKATFDEDPRWQIQSEDGKLVASRVDDSGTGGSASDTDSANQDGTKSSSGGTSDPPVPGTEQSDNDSQTNGNSDDAGLTTSGNQDSTASANSETNTSASSQTNASTDGTSRASGTSDSSGSSSEADTDGSDEESDTRGSGSGSGGSGPDGERTTEDPSTGNGSGSGRDVIPGDAGNEWRPGNTADTPRPDYSDPVPRNPDVPSPDEDTDLITGGDKPEPRGNNQSISAFGESIISTLVSSWPVFVLAACGMAAVGFILFLVGRRTRQEA